MTVLAVLTTLATATAAVGLWVGARRHRATVARGYRWLSGAALFWCAGLILQSVMARSLTSGADPLSLADVAPLLALGATAVGIMVLASPAADVGPPPAAADGSAPGTQAQSSGSHGSIRPVSVLPGLADGYVTAVSLLVMGWVVAFGAEYHISGERPGAFLFDLLHPLADLAVLGALLPVLTVAWQRTLLPYLSLVAATGADSLGVGARISEGHEGVLEQLAMIAAAFLLGAAPWVKTIAARLVPVPWLWDGEAVTGRAAGPASEGAALLGAPVGDQGAALPDGPGLASGGGVATVIAAITAGVAAIFVVVNGLASAPASGLALVIAGGAAVIVVIARVLMLVRDNSVAVRLWRHSGGSLRDLADRTSDMVLICDLDGTITYASPGGVSFSYAQEELVGQRLAEFVHPEDIPVARSVVREALGLTGDIDPVAIPDAAAGPLPDADDAIVPLGAEGGEAARGRLACRVRAADGTWRHVECAVLLYQVPGEPPRMLITARDVSDEVALRQQVAHLTFHDGVTGLPNRAYLEDRVRGALPDMPDMAGVIFLDLDGFTAVNDSVGHGAGDVVLAQAARRLRAAVPARDTVARWGGDEFAVLVEAAAGHELPELAERLAEAIAGEPFRVADREVSLSASVGVALVGASERTPELLLRNADVAMSRAKAAGGDRVDLYAEYMHVDVLRRMELTSDLKRAIDRGELALVYQPVIELATSRVVGVEAYVRWQREDDEEIDPGEFLAIAEDRGIGVALGDWVLRTACAQGERWRAAGWDVTVAVNLSARQLAAPRLVADLAGVLAETGLDPSALAIEVSERAFLAQPEEVAGRLAELRELGLRLAIDDFGTGHVSLAYLRENPVDVIKIDPSFVAGLGHDPTLTPLTRTIIQMGRDLGLEVVAEGVEQPRELAELTEMGCRYGQGFLLARPMTAPAVEALFRDTTSEPSRARVSKAGAA